jgi:hypothetical protein
LSYFITKSIQSSTSGGDAGYFEAKSAELSKTYNSQVMKHESGQNMSPAQQDELRRQEESRREAVELVTKAAADWRNFLGFAIDVDVPSQTFLAYLERKKAEQDRNIGIVYWPGKDVEFKKDSNYPGWHVKLDEWYSKNRANGKIPENHVNNQNQWIVIDTTRAPDKRSGNQEYLQQYSDGDPFNLKEIIYNLRRNCTIPGWDEYEGEYRGMQYPDSRYSLSWDNINESVLPSIAEEERVERASVLLPTYEQFNVLGNMYYPEWGQTQTLEWLNHKIGPNRSLAGGNSKFGGLGYIATYLSDDIRHSFIGFRPMIAFPSKT